MLPPAGSLATGPFLRAFSMWDRELLDQLSQAMRDASICGLGQAASNPLSCVIKYFPDEFKEAAE